MKSAPQNKLAKSWFIRTKLMIFPLKKNFIHVLSRWKFFFLVADNKFSYVLPPFAAYEQIKQSPSVRIILNKIS